MPVRTFRVFLSNNTDFPLIRANHHLCHGDWTSSNWEPPPVIEPKTERGWQSESNGIATGTEGWVKYCRGVPPIVIPGGTPPPPTLAETIYIYWDNPFLAFGEGTSGKCSVTLGDVTADCDEDNHGDGGNTFPDPTVNFEIVRTGFNNAGAAYDDDLFTLAQIPIAPLVIFGTVTIVEHALVRLTFRQKGSLRQALPLGYDASQGLRRFQNNPAATSLRSIFSLSV